MHNAKQWSKKDILASSLQELKTPRLQWSSELYLSAITCIEMLLTSTSYQVSWAK